MADHPILFSAPMVRALLDGRKTQTRRILKPQPTINSAGLLVWKRGADFIQGTAEDVAVAQRIKTGDRLWVRERVHIDGRQANYAADAHPERDLAGCGYRPSIHMPRWASRLTLTTTDTRVEQLKDISEDDAVAEGVVKADHSARLSCGTLEWSIFSTPGSSVDGSPVSARDHFADLWDHINGPGAWQQNPWVTAYTFTVERQNIDEVTT